jgi:hypothetical protein
MNGYVLSRWFGEVWSLLLQTSFYFRGEQSAFSTQQSVVPGAAICVNVKIFLALASSPLYGESFF